MKSTTNQRGTIIFNDHAVNTADDVDYEYAAQIRLRRERKAAWRQSCFAVLMLAMLAVVLAAL